MDATEIANYLLLVFINPKEDKTQKKIVISMRDLPY